MHRKILYGLTYLAASLSLAHHIDHAIRHTPVGGPLTGEVNAFTMSLIIYPIIITGLLMYRAGLVGPGFWALVSGGGAVFVCLVPFGRTPAEPPAMMLHGYDSPILGWFSFTLLVTFVTVLAVTSLYETRLWWQQHQERRTLKPAAGAAGTP